MALTVQCQQCARIQCRGALRVRVRERSTPARKIGTCAMFADVLPRQRSYGRSKPMLLQRGGRRVEQKTGSACSRGANANVASRAVARNGVVTAQLSGMPGQYV